MLFFSTVRKFYGPLIKFTQLLFKCVINNRDEVIEIKKLQNTIFVIYTQEEYLNITIKCQKKVNRY